MSLTTLHVCVLCMCTISGSDIRGGQKRVSDPLEVWVVLSHPVSAGNWLNPGPLQE